MSAPVPLVVFSDLDGTLLDHANYSWDPAKPALARLAAIDAPVVLASSKTAAEVAVVQREMGLQGYPAIVENGAGLIWETLKLVHDPVRHEAVMNALGRVPADLRAKFHGFSDMSVEEVAQQTGLTVTEAACAKQRAFSEPGMWTGTKDERALFLEALKDNGIAARQGGRFLTLSHGTTKADRMAEVIAHFTPKYTLALGDAPNDIEMLAAADFGVIIANPAGTRVPRMDGEEDGTIIRTALPGPKGWNKAILDLINTLNLENRAHRHG